MRKLKSEIELQCYDRFNLAGDDKYFFSQPHVNEFLNFISVFKHCKGLFAGDEIKLLDWELFIVNNFIGMRYRSNVEIPKYRQAYVEIPKKNGKSFLCSLFCLFYLFKQALSGGEIYCVASNREQATIVYDSAKAMVMQTPLANLVVANLSAMKVWNTNTYLRVLPFSPTGADGWNPSFIVIDELHTHRNRQMLDTMRQGLAGRREGQMIVITTAGNINTVAEDEHNYALNVLNKVIDNQNYFTFICSADEKPTEENILQLGEKANPCWGVSIDPQLFKSDFEYSKTNAESEYDFLRKRLNLWQINNEASFDANKLDVAFDTATKLYPTTGAEVAIGVDLSSVRDFSSISICWQEAEDYFVKSIPFLPSERILPNEKTDRVPYSAWVTQNYLLSCGKDIIDYEEIFLFLKSIVDEKKLIVSSVYMDITFGQHFISRCEEVGWQVVGVRNYPKAQNSIVTTFENLVSQEKVFFESNPCVKWQFKNCKTKVNQQGCRSFYKSKNKEKIDSVISSALAVNALIANKQSYIGEQVIYVD